MYELLPAALMKYSDVQIEDLGFHQELTVRKFRLSDFNVLWELV